MSRFVFLDRDGTLVRDVDYTHRIEDCVLLPGVVPGLLALRRAGFRLAIVTNQAGIARGYYSEAEYERFQAHLLGELRSAGIELDAVYHCPHHPEDGCACRKPRTGMLLRAERELGADLAESWVIGDRVTDVELARRAGCRGAVLVLTGPPDAHAELPPDLSTARDLVDASRLIAG